MRIIRNFSHNKMTLQNIPDVYPKEHKEFVRFAKNHDLWNNGRVRHGWTGFVGICNHFFATKGIQCGVLSSDIVAAFEELHNPSKPGTEN